MGGPAPPRVTADRLEPAPDFSVTQTYVLPCIGGLIAEPVKHHD